MALITLTSHQGHDIFHPGWILFLSLNFCFSAGQILNRVSFNSTRCFDKDSTSAISLTTRQAFGFSVSPLPPPLGTRHTTVIMKTSLVLLGSLASLGLAVPTQTISYQWSPELAEFYSAVDNHIQKARARGLTLQPPTCDLSNAVMPVAPTPLPTPAPGLILREVAIGRGVQVRAPQPPCAATPPY